MPILYELAGVERPQFGCKESMSAVFSMNKPLLPAFESWKKPLNN
jgi:hypothetical protein